MTDDLTHTARRIVGSGHSRDILATLRSAFTVGGSPLLERVKHVIAEESGDFEDFATAVERSPRVLEVQAFIARTALPYAALDPRIRTNVISDLDNTAIENATVAPITYIDSRLVFGFTPLLKTFTRSLTTPTFISARPGPMEIPSIISAKRSLSQHNIPFAFESGSIAGTLYYFAARSVRAAIGTDAAVKTRAWKGSIGTAATTYAAQKFKNYRRVSQYFPGAGYVFFGDDTQGDYIFALQFVIDRPQNRAFVRMVADPRVSMSPRSAAWPLPRDNRPPHPRIIEHASYYEAGEEAARRSWMDASQAAEFSKHVAEEYPEYTQSLSRFSLQTQIPRDSASIARILRW
jgi:hypothetical protein